MLSFSKVASVLFFISNLIKQCKRKLCPPQHDITDHQCFSKKSHICQTALIVFPHKSAENHPEFESANCFVSTIQTQGETRRCWLHKGLSISRHKGLSVSRHKRLSISRHKRLLISRHKRLSVSRHKRLSVAAFGSRKRVPYNVRDRVPYNVTDTIIPEHVRVVRELVALSTGKLAHSARSSLCRWPWRVGCCPF